MKLLTWRFAQRDFFLLSQRPAAACTHCSSCSSPPHVSAQEHYRAPLTMPHLSRTSNVPFSQARNRQCVRVLSWLMGFIVRKLATRMVYRLLPRPSCALGWPCLPRRRQHFRHDNGRVHHSLRKWQLLYRRSPRWQPLLLHLAVGVVVYATGVLCQ